MVKFISLIGLAITLIGAELNKKWISDLGFGICMAAIVIAHVRLAAYLLG